MKGFVLSELPQVVALILRAGYSLMSIAVYQPICEFSNSSPGAYWRPGPYSLKPYVTPAIIGGPATKRVFTVISIEYILLSAQLGQKKYR